MSRNSTFFETAFSSSLKRQELEELGSETHSTGRDFSHFSKTRGIVCKLCNPTLRAHYALNLHCVVIIAAQRAPSDPQGASGDKTCTLQTFAIHIVAKLVAKWQPPSKTCALETYTPSLDTKSSVQKAPTVQKQWRGETDSLRSCAQAARPIQTTSESSTGKYRSSGG